MPAPPALPPPHNKGVDVVAVHGDKDQEERLAAISGFKGGTKDVLVATDVASKGLDFPGVQHVINYDMPDEIENYVHRRAAGGLARGAGAMAQGNCCAASGAIFCALMRSTDAARSTHAK